MTEYKLVVVGGVAVGKSALTLLLVQDNCYWGDCDPNIEDSFRKQVRIDDETCLLEIYDTTGTGYSGARLSFMREAHGVLCVYSITSRSSFDAITSFRDNVLRVKNEDHVPMILVGTKCDLEDKRQVSVAEAQELATSFGCPFFETSAKARINVDGAFYQLVREIRDHSEGGDTPEKKKATCCVQ